MFEIVFLGTSASAPSAHRGLSSAAVIADDTRFLVDCGEGTQRQILRSGIGFKRLNNILLTHSHLDHILGLGGLISTFARWESVEELNIWGGRSTIKRTRTLIHEVVLQEQKSSIPIRFCDLEKGEFFEAKRSTVHAFPVTHRGPGCFGFIFQENSRRPFLAAKAEALGIEPGPQRGKLVKGESITLPDSRIITPDMVLGEEIPGTKIVFTGDTAQINNLYEAAENADALVIEGTFLNHEKELARQYGHITAREAAILAREACVQNLLITHVSRRYREQDIINEARAIFPGAIVARDLEHYIVRRGEPIRKKSFDRHKHAPETDSEMD